MTDHAHTLLILTDAESRLIRACLEQYVLRQPLAAFNAGITRGTEKMAAEVAERQKAKRK